MMQENAFCEVTYGVFVKLYKHCGLGPCAMELGGEFDNSEATTSEKEESKGKGPAPEPLGIGASAMKTSPPDFHADKEAFEA